MKIIRKNPEWIENEIKELREELSDIQKECIDTLQPSFSSEDFFKALIEYECRKFTAEEKLDYWSSIINSMTESKNGVFKNENNL